MPQHLMRLLQFGLMIYHQMKQGVLIYLFGVNHLYPTVFIIIMDVTILCSIRCYFLIGIVDGIKGYEQFLMIIEHGDTAIATQLLQN